MTTMREKIYVYIYIFSTVTACSWGILCFYCEIHSVMFKNVYHITEQPVHCSCFYYYFFHFIKTIYLFHIIDFVDCIYFQLDVDFFF